MGSSEKFCLRWNDFEANVSRSFAGIRDHNQFFDCTLTTDDDEAYSDNLRAHKVILSACSEFFRNILTKESMSAHPNPLIYLRGISAQDMKYILDFMYHGEVNVAQEELDKFLEVAETLKIKGLTQGSNGSRQASKRPAASSAVSSSPSPGEPRKKPKMHSAVTPSTPSSAPKTEAEVSVKTETGPSVPVGAEDFEESVGGEDDYGGGGDEDYGEDFEGEYEGDDDGAVAGPSGGGGGESGGGGAGGATKDARKGRTVYGEAERRTLLNLIQAIDKNHILLSSENAKSTPVLLAKHEIWKQVMESFNQVTGKKASLFKLRGILNRMKHKWCGKYLEYDPALGIWRIL